MIGNEIEFNYFSKCRGILPEIKKGIIIDAYTEITGRVSGKTESIFGFGEGSVSGSTGSTRKYKIMYFSEFDKERKNQYFCEISEWQVNKIIRFANNFKEQEKNEEKITTDKK